MLRTLAICTALAVSSAVAGETTAKEEALQASVHGLRGSIGRWNVQTRFLRPDGSAAKTVGGNCEFSWVVAGRVVSGRSEIPQRQQAAGIVFFINETKRTIEMVSVGADGNLWTMTGPLGGNRRMSQEFATANRATRRLLFTPLKVTPEAFESKMEYTDDGGKTWTAGNHQRFVRQKQGEPRCSQGSRR